MKAYHKTLGFPEKLVVPDIIVKLQYTIHAEERKKREGKYDLKVLPSVVKVNSSNVFEIHTEDDIICKKVAIRIHYDHRRDIILILELINENKAKVVTFWLNSKKDNHKNFKKEKYTIPENKIVENE